MRKKREKVNVDPIYLRTERQKAYAQKVIQEMPLDDENPVEVIVREKPKKRKMSLNDAMWAGPLKDIAEKAWHNNRQYSADEWHEGFKVLFLPDPDSSDFDPTHVVNPETYRKWSINPVTGQRLCIGSTTQLTDAGMRFYIMQMEAFAAEKFFVEFTTIEQPEGRTIK